MGMSDGYGSFGGSDGYGQGSQNGPYGSDPYGTGASASYGAGAQPVDPYASDRGAADPYAADPLAQEGFGPIFTSSDPGYVPGGHGAYGPSSNTQMPVPGGYSSYMPPPTSGAAITAFVVGLVSIVLCGGFPAPVGLVFAVIAMKETSPASATTKSGRGFAITGLVLNILGTLYLLLAVLYIVLVIVLGVWGSTQ